MAERPEERLIGFLQSELDEELQGVYRYGGDGVERLWPAGAPARPRPDAVVERCVAAIDQFSESSRVGGPAGGSAADGVLWLVDGRAVVVLPGAGDAGHIVTIDRRPDRPETALVEACLSTLD